jgi:hypothetical protein
MKSSWFFPSTLPYSRFCDLLANIKADPSSIEKIRAFMLLLLQEPQGEHNKVILALQRAIIHEQDVQALWFLRSEWMQCLAYTCGEKASIEHVHNLDELFKGMLPNTWFSSPSPLA